MKVLFAELRRRRVFRTAAWYIVGSWLALQVADVLFPALDIPEQSIRYLLYACVLGFPVALVFGWFFDIGPDGIHRTGPAAESVQLTQEPLRRTDFLLLGALAAVLATILYGTLGQVATQPPTSGSPEQALKHRAEGPPLVALMPFTFSGEDEESAFFATGVHDDLITRVAGLAGLRVISRAAVLEFDHGPKSVTEIGRQLGADAVMEGNIQVAGEQMRINVVLVDTHSEEDLWAQSFDRRLTPGNIFAAQADIATAISTALRATLTQAEAAELNVMPTENMAAYRAYHEAMRLKEKDDGKPGRYERFIAGLERAIELDPSFVRPMTELAEALAQENFNRQSPAAIQRIETIIDRLRELKPNSVEHLTAQAYYTYYIVKDYDIALRLLARARALSPSNPKLLDVKSWIQRRTGDYAGWLESIEIAQQLEPGNLTWRYRLARALRLMHRYPDALREAEDIDEPNFDMQHNQIILRMQLHRDLARYRDELQAAVEWAREDTWDAPYALWEAQLALDDYAAATATRLSVDDPEKFRGEVQRILPASEQAAMVEALLLDDTGALQQAASQAQQTLGLDADMMASGAAAAGDLDVHDPSLALVLIATGQAQSAEQLLQRYLRKRADDHTALMMTRQTICQLFGLADAAAAAVQCLRDSLSEPSLVTPFLEPWLPYYDRIHASAPFQELVTELQAEGWLKAQE